MNIRVFTVTAASWLVIVGCGKFSVDSQDGQLSSFGSEAAKSGVPSIPGNLSATVASSNQINLSWSASRPGRNSTVTAYSIFRNGVKIVSVSGMTLSYSDSSLMPATTYVYQVAAEGSNGKSSSLSAPVSATTDSIASMTPTPTPTPVLPTPTPIPTPVPTPTPAPIMPSLDGTRAPPASEIVDSSLNIWTIRSVDSAILVNGQHAGGGYGSAITWCSAIVRVLGTDNNWWQWNGSGWFMIGNDPCLVPDPQPTPTPVPTPAPAPGPSPSSQVGDEEFVGPFPNWMNVKTQFGAKGDGVTDDTVAIQNAINALSPTQPVLYFPSGNYLITRTVSVVGQNSISIIGEDPSTTSIVWGSVGITLKADGVWNSTINSGQSSVITWSSTNATSCTGTNFSTGNSTSGSVTVTPSSTTTYAVTCTGNAGKAAAQTTVTVLGSTGGPTGYTLCATGDVGATCSFSGQAMVAYGGNGQFTYRTITDGTPCSVQAFGVDPAGGFAKFCYYNFNPVTTVKTAATFAGSISDIRVNGSGFYNATLTVSNVSGQLAVGQRLDGKGIPLDTYIGKILGPNTYSVSSGWQFTPIASQQMTTTEQAMLALVGISGSRIDRLTFNGHGAIGTLVDSRWDGLTYFDTFNEYADDVFENAALGFGCGSTGGGCAETSMLRNKFINLSTAGIKMRNYNALDMWVWYSTFENNAVGITTHEGAGGVFHINNSIFLNSSVSDIFYETATFIDFRNNYSRGSERVLQGGGSGVNHILMQGNVILDTKRVVSIYENDFGPLTFLDNIVRTSPTAKTEALGAGVYSSSAGPVVLIGNGYWTANGDVFSMGNTFTTGSGSCSWNSPTKSPGHCHSFNDQIVPYNTVNPPMPTLPGTPPNNNRRIFEIQPGSSAAQIQAAINNAVASGAARPVVHIQAGEQYFINQTITVPANSDLQIIGDGSFTQLTWVGPSGGVMLDIQGPSKATLRAFSVNGGNYNAGTAIRVSNADQPGGRIFMEGTGNCQSNTLLFVDGLDYTSVEMHNSYICNQSIAPAPSGPAVKIVGGPSAAAGTWKGSVTSAINAVLSGNNLSFGVSNGAHFVGRGLFYDSGDGQLASVSGPSSFTYAASLVSQASFPQIEINNFTGTAALLNLILWGDVGISGANGGGQILGLSLGGRSSTFWSDTSSPRAATEFLNSMTPHYGPAVDLPEQGCCDIAFLNNTLKDLRTTQSTLPSPLPAGVTDLRIYRVGVGVSQTGIHIKP